MKTQTTTPVVDPEREYPNVANILYKLAWKVSERHPVSFEEARSEAEYAFMKACYTYDPGRGARFSSWCYFTVWAHLKTFIMRRTEDPLTCIEIDDDLLGAAPPDVSPSLDVIEELSEDAKQIARFLLRPPQPINGFAGTPLQFLRKLKDYMVEQGWSRNRVETAVRELRTALRHAWAS